jgi:hypothetical protein
MVYLFLQGNTKDRIQSYRMTAAEEKDLQRKIRNNSIAEPNSGCWLWERSIVNGYGHAKYTGRGEEVIPLTDFLTRLSTAPFPQAYVSCTNVIPRSV